MCQEKYNKETRKGKHLTYKERQDIKYWKNNLNLSNIEIAKLLGKSERTIRRELKRGEIIKWNDRKLNYLPTYNPDEAQRKYEWHKTGKGPQMILDVDKELSTHVEEQLIKFKKSPEVIVVELEKFGFWKSCVCAKTIRNAINDGMIFTNIEPCKIIYRKKKRKKSVTTRRAKKIPPEKSIEARPEEANKREEYGHWEGDTVIGKRKKGAVLLVLTERKTREERIIKIPDKTKESVINGLKVLTKGNKKTFKKFKTITFDNGSEFNDYKEMEEITGAKVFYAHPYRSGERGSNENNNKFIRRFLPKRTSFDHVTNEEIKQIEDWINNYPRKILQYKSTNEILEELCIASR